MALLGPRCHLTRALLIRLQLNVSYVTAHEVITHSHSVCVRIKVRQSAHETLLVRRVFGFLALLGVYCWFAITPVDLQTRIEHYVLAPPARRLCARDAAAVMGTTVRPLTHPPPVITSRPRARLGR